MSTRVRTRIRTPSRRSMRVVRSRIRRLNRNTRIQLSQLPTFRPNNSHRRLPRAMRHQATSRLPRRIRRLPMGMRHPPTSRRRRRIRRLHRGMWHQATSSRRRRIRRLPRSMRHPNTNSHLRRIRRLRRGTWHQDTSSPLRCIRSPLRRIRSRLRPTRRLPRGMAHPLMRWLPRAFRRLPRAMHQRPHRRSRPVPKTTSRIPIPIPPTDQEMADREMALPVHPRPISCHLSPVHQLRIRVRYSQACPQCILSGRPGGVFHRHRWPARSCLRQWQIHY